MCKSWKYKSPPLDGAAGRRVSQVDGDVVLFWRGFATCCNFFSFLLLSGPPWLFIAVEHRLTSDPMVKAHVVQDSRAPITNDQTAIIYYIQSAGLICIWKTTLLTLLWSRFIICAALPGQVSHAFVVRVISAPIIYWLAEEIEEIEEIYMSAHAALSCCTRSPAYFRYQRV